MKAIITFHSIDDSGSFLSFSINQFENLLSSLSKLNIPIVSLDELLKKETKKGIALTFDDGMKSLFTKALPVLRDYNAVAHLYLTTGVVGKDNMWPTQPKHAPRYDILSWGEVEQLSESGIYIESHTVNHPDMRALSLSQIEEECNTADDEIEKRVGRRPRYFAYPYGFKNEKVSNYVSKHYIASVTTEFRVLDKNEDASLLPRLDAYYLQPSWLQHNFDSLLVKYYLQCRGVIRTLRGTQ